VVDHDRVVAALPAYDISGELGRGAYGVVLAGRHRQLGRLVAIKQLPLGSDPGLRTRFLAEARVLATLDHPHIVAIYDFVDDDGLCMVVMERLTGGTVWSRFHAGGFTPDVSCAILLAVCAGLHHAHQHGVLHRDIKPENLMFSGEGTLKVTDLGIAKVVGGSATLATRAGEVLGTPAYISPEQARGAELTPSTDVYQAGTVLYELLAGRLPYPVDSDAATTLYRHVHEPSPPLLEVAHHIPAELAAVTDRSISTSPSDRYQSAEEFGIAIASCAAQTWGRGWLVRTNVPVSASGPILLAALGELESAAKLAEPATAPSVRLPPEPQEPLPGEYVPVQLVHPELRSVPWDHGDTHESEGHDDDLAAGHPSGPMLPPDVREAGLSSGAGSAIEGDANDSRQRAPSQTAARTGTTDDAAAGGQRAPAHGATAARSGARARRTPRRSLFFVAGCLVIVAALVGTALAFRGGSSHRTPATTGTASQPAVLTASAWRVLPGAPTARQQVGATVSQGVMWIFGGLTNGAATNKVEGYDPTISTWESGPNLPLQLHHAIAVVYRGNMVVMGGWVPSGSTLDASVSNRVFALQNGAWVELPPLLHARAAGAAAVVGDKIVVSGGQADHQLVAQTEVFDGTKWTDVAPMPTLRDHLAGVADRRYFYAVGGRALSADKNLGAVERYDPATNEWTRLPALPTPRGGLGAAIVGGRLVTLGGESPTSVFDTVEVLDLTTNTWTTLPPMKTPRHGMAVLAVGNTVYAVDGAGAPGHTDSVNTNEAIDVS
jgi:non-specific serine/threonine protein kinase